MKKFYFAAVLFCLLITSIVYAGNNPITQSPYTTNNTVNANLYVSNIVLQVITDTNRIIVYNGAGLTNLQSTNIVGLGSAAYSNAASFVGTNAFVTTNALKADLASLTIAATNPTAYVAATNGVVYGTLAVNQYIDYPATVTGPDAQFYAGTYYYSYTEYTESGVYQVATNHNGCALKWDWQGIYEGRWTLSASVNAVNATYHFDEYWKSGINQVNITTSVDGAPGNTQYFPFRVTIGSGNLLIAGTNTAAYFSGNGGGLANLQATNIAGLGTSLGQAMSANAAYVVSGAGVAGANGIYNFQAGVVYTNGTFYLYSNAVPNGTWAFYGEEGIYYTNDNALAPIGNWGAVNPRYAPAPTVLLGLSNQFALKTDLANLTIAATNSGAYVAATNGTAYNLTIASGNGGGLTNLQSTNIVTELITLTPELIPYIALYGTNTIKFTMAFLGAVNVPMTWDGEKYTDGVNYIYKSGSAWLFHDDPNSYNADLFLNSATFPWEGTWVVNNEFASGYSLTVITNTPDAYTNTGIVIWDFAASEQQIVDARNPNFTSLQIIPTNALAGRKSALRIQANTTMPIVITNQLAWLNGVDNTNVITSDVLISAQCWSENLTDTAAAISSVGSLTVDNLSVGNLSVGSGNGGGLTNLQATNIVFQDKIWSGTELNDYYNAILELNNGYQRYEWGGDNVFTITGITPAATGKPRWTSFKLLNSYSGNITLTISITDARAIGSASPFTIPQNKVAWITIHDDGQGTAWSITYAVAIEP